MRLRGAWAARPETQAVCAALTAAGHVALFVGGCVRNDLLGAEVADIDIATDARPRQVMDLATAAGLKPVPTGIEHGTVTVVSGHRAHEVTTFRHDVEGHGRHATVAWADDMAADAARRDFTMNALYATPAGEVLDPLGGLADLRARRVRFVGTPATRIAEDYLRILRFFRFHAWYGDPGVGLDPEGLAACAAAAAGLERLSRERVGAELRKLLSAPDPAPAVAAMAAAGVLARVLPEADATALAALVHLEAGAPVRWLRRLAVLGGDATGLRLTKAETRGLATLRAALATAAGPEELGYRLGAEAGADALLVRAALGGAPPPGGWRATLARGASAQCPVRAADLMPALNGPALGRRLAAIEARWIASGFTLTRDELLS